METLCSILAFTTEGKSSEFWFTTIFCSVFTLVGVAAFFYGLYQLLKGLHAKKWPTAIATIIKTNSRTIPGESSATYKLEVLYRYAVDGRQFEGTVIHATYCGLNNIEAARKLETMLSPNQLIYVYYNPSKPQDCMLAPGFYSGPMAALSAGLVFVSMGIGFFFIFYSGMISNSDFVSGIQAIIPQ